MKKILKIFLMMIIFCLLPLWGFLPVFIAGLISEWLGKGTGIVIGVIFGIWFYVYGIVMIPFDGGFFPDELLGRLRFIKEQPLYRG